MTTVVGTANTIVGQYGSMPIDMLMRKQEETCMYENPHLVEENLRSLLKDYKPDAPFLASDEMRGGVDEYGNDRGGYQSQSTINLRSGSRTLTDPFLPDGSFLDQQFLEKDPRGVALGPDMRKHADQQYARKNLIKYYDDSDNSVISGTKNPWAMQMDIRNSQNVVKDYFKIFDTAKDGWHNGGIAPGYSVSNKEKFMEGQEIKDPINAPNVNRIDVTNNLSNDTSIGWRRTTDNRFQVAKYGKKNSLKSFTTEDWYKNRSNTHIDHDKYVSWQDNNVNKSTALKMMDLAKQKELYQFTGLNGINFGQSAKGKNKQKKLTPADMAGMVNRPTAETRAADAHGLLNGEQKPTSGEKLIIHDVKNIEKTYINPTIVEKMSNVNKQATKEIKDDLRNDIKKSVDDHGIYMVEDNKKRNVLDINPLSLWNSLTVYTKGKSMSVKNYKAAAMKIEEGGKKLEKISKDIDFKESYTGNQRRGKLDISKNQDINTSKVDNDYGREVERAHLVGPLGNKYMTPHMECDTDQNDINDTDRSCGI
jgi:hypothetical protein